MLNKLLSISGLLKISDLIKKATSQKSFDKGLVTTTANCDWWVGDNTNPGRITAGAWAVHQPGSDNINQLRGG